MGSRRTRAQIGWMALADVLWLAFAFAVTVAANSLALYVLVLSCLGLGAMIGSVAYRRLGDEPVLPLAPFGPLLLGFGMFAVTGGPIFIIGLAVFLVGVSLAGAAGGTVLRLAINLPRRRSVMIRGR